MRERRIQVAPVIGGGLTYAASSVETPLELASSAWRLVDEGVEHVLRAHQHARGQAVDEASAGEMLLPAMWAHTIRGRSWDAVSARNGLVLTTDSIHFNGRGAAIIADRNPDETETKRGVPATCCIPRD